MKNNKQKFHEANGLPENANLDIHQIATISGYPEDALKQIYRRATAIKPGAKDDPFNQKKTKKKIKAVEGFIIDTTGKGKGYSRIYAFVMGKYGKDLDIATTFGLVPESEPVSQPKPVQKKVVLSSQCLDWFPVSGHSTESEYDSDSLSL